MTEDWHYFYFKEKRSLVLDADKVAIQHPGRSMHDKARGLLARNGASQCQAEAWPIAGWSLGKGLAKTHPAAGRPDLIRTLASDPEIQFVSPVFIGRNGGPVFITQDLLVGFNPGISLERADAILAAVNAGKVTDRDFGKMRGATCYRVRAATKDGCEVLALANRLAQLPEVRFAEPNTVFTGSGSLIPTDPDFANSWGLNNTGQSGGTQDIDMDAPEAWDLTSGSPSIIVAVIDTGVQQDHPELNQVSGEDVTNDPGSTGDGGPVNQFDKHGTAVAGCISAAMNNSRGTVGIAPNCRVLSIRTFISTDNQGQWTSQADWTVQALTRSEARGARVSNNSNAYNSANQSSAIEQAYQDRRIYGMVHFASAGNDGQSFLSYPASLSVVNAVAAIDRTGALAVFAGGCFNGVGGSNHGQGLDFSAPGEDIFTTDRTGADGYNDQGDFTCIDGTSFASPYAAGVAALILSRNPSLTAQAVERVMRQSCVDLGDPGYDTTFGHGLVNAHQALLVQMPALDSQSVSPPSGNTGQSYTYSVHYLDPAGLAPLQARVDIDGFPFTMTRTSGTDANGTYSFSKSNLGTGAHVYWFVFTAADGTTLILPQPGSFSGPTVSQSEPGAPSIVITSPTSGTTWTTRRSVVYLYGVASSSTTQVTWRNETTGSQGPATGTASWSTVLPRQACARPKISKMSAAAKVMSSAGAGASAPRVTEPLLPQLLSGVIPDFG